MQFCTECHNMYYLKIQDEDGNIGNTLIYYCRNCGHENNSLSTTNICVSDIQLRSSEKKYTHIVNEYTKHDPTLPRINTIKCPNQECVSNGAIIGETSIGGASIGGGASKKNAADNTQRKNTTKLKKIEQAETASMLASVQQSVETAENAANQAQHSLAIAENNLQTIITENQTETNTYINNEINLITNNREVIYIRYDDINMKYVYLCVHCDTTWRTDNRL